MEGLRLRIKVVNLVVVCQAKGDKNQVVMPPRSLTVGMRPQVLAAPALWEQDRKAQRGGVEVPHALEAKFPCMGQRWGWFWVFPASSPSVDLRTGMWQRRHLYEERLQRALKKAVAQAGTCKSVSVYTLRHGFATHLLQSGTIVTCLQSSPSMSLFMRYLANYG